MNRKNNQLELYQLGPNFLWTDAHISQQMLLHHLNTATDAASRNSQAIDQTIDWLVDVIPARCHIIDLGCGPGLYTERLAERGFQVTGVDISENSLDYARQSAQAKDLPIDYHHLNYLLDDLPGQYQAAICIYADFGALIPSQQTQFLKNVAASLVPGGVLIFDVFNDNYSLDRQDKRDWHYSSEPDFWSEQPHYILSEEKFFPEANTWGTRDIVIDETTREFITWDTLYSSERIKLLLAKHDFTVEDIKQDLLADNRVMFVKARK